VKAVTHALALGLTEGFLPRAVVTAFLFAPSASVPHTTASTYMGGVGENIGQRHTPLVTLADCVRGTAKDGWTW
jgi:hypothetical protein